MTIGLGKYTWRKRKPQPEFYRQSSIIFSLLLASALAAPDPAAERYWPQWRGPYATGVSQHADPPLEWSETKNSVDAAPALIDKEIYLRGCQHLYCIGAP